MSDQWRLLVFDQGKPVCTAELTGPAELGRQTAVEETLYTPRAAGGRQRLAIALKDERSTSRQQILVEPRADGGFLVTNIGGERPITLPDGSDLAPKAQRVVEAETALRLGTKSMRLSRADGRKSSLQSLAEVTVAPGRYSGGGSLPILPRSAAADAGLKSLLQWLRAAADVLQSAAGSADFFEKAARAVVELVHLDSGQVLLLRQDEWKLEAYYTDTRFRGVEPNPPSHHVLQKVLQEKRAFWDVPDASKNASSSLLEVEAVVAAPILDGQGAVIGALYGDRRGGAATVVTQPITELEAVLVEVLARGVAAGLVRQEQEKAVLAAHVQFEQFFTPELARQLARQPNLLDGRDTEVSILFCDIRGFSRISQRLGPAKTMEWIGDVMGTLSDCVRSQAGVLVDYIGDELMAMWGAPEEQPDHAALACRAALAMLVQVPLLNARWLPVMGEAMNLGIGINTGPARVGNTGSRIKFKYGPLGTTVNVASRVQGATKYLKCRAVMTGATKEAVGEAFPTRRLCEVQVVNIETPVGLHELVLDDQPQPSEAKTVYEQALTDFEAQDFAKAARALSNWRLQCPHDEPALILLYRAVRCMVEGAAPLHPVWVLPGK